MGEVYRAQDTVLRRAVALKILHEDATALPGQTPGVARMLREARAAASLEHPNVVKVYDVGELPGLPGTAYLAMELIKGSSLRALLNGEPVPLAERMRWLSDIANALGAAHAQGFVHRDVKPENVMLREDGVVKVLDFGIAIRDANAPSQTMTQTSTSATTGQLAVGTPYYMAPEQLRGEPLDGRADQFAWGVLAYEILARPGPWSRDIDGLGLVSQILSREPTAPHELAPDVSLNASRAILRALSKAKEQRFASMGDLLEAFQSDAPEAVDATMPTMPAPPPPPPPALSAANIPAPAVAPTPPRARAAWLVALVAVAAFAVAVGYATRRPRTVPPAPDAAAALARCASNMGCTRAHGGDAHRCRKADGVCVRLAAPGCEVHAEPSDLEDEDTVWIGTQLGARPARTNTIELARRDFAGAPKQIPVPGGIMRRRPIAVVSCDNALDARAAARHLLDDVGAPAIIGFMPSEQTVDLLTGEVLPREALAMLPLATSSIISSLRTPANKPRLIWRTTNNTAQMALAVSALVASVLEPRLHAEGRPTLKVALLRPPYLGGVGFSDALVSSLRFNGASVAENGDRFTEYVLTAQNQDGVAQARQTLRERRPDIIVYYGNEELDVLRPLEHAQEGERHRPYYVSALPLTGLDAQHDAPSMLKRLFGLTTPGNTLVNAKFTLHYNATFAEHISPDFSPNTTYDAFYVLAYAAIALGTGAASPEALAGAIARLTGPGQVVEVGPASLLGALADLAEGRAIDLEGSASKLDFDLTTGEVATDHAVQCVALGAGGKAAGVESGLVYDAKLQKLRGELRCR